MRQRYIHAAAESSEPVTISVNHQVRQNGGATITLSVAPVRFQTPSEFAATTRN